MKNIIQKFSFVFAFCAVFAMFGAVQAQAAAVVQTGSYTATTTTATLYGTYNTDGQTMDVWFEYADNSGFYGSIDTPHESVNGVSLVYSKTITGLIQNKRYYYRMMGEGHGQFPYGSTATLITDSTAVSSTPTILTTGAVNVSTTSANITCVLNTGGDPTADVYFNYGTTSTNLNSQTATQTLTTGATCTSFLSNLSPNTTYYYRAVATNSVAATRSTTIGQFKTLPNGGGGTVVAPTISLNSASNITVNSATLSCNVTSGGDPSVSVYFQYGQNGNMSFSTPAQTITNGSNCTSYIYNLMPYTTYTVQAFATNSIASTTSNQITFTTNGGGTGGYSLPSAVTNYVSNTSSTSTNISCSFYTGGYPTADVYFEYGQNGNMSFRTQTQTLSSGASCTNYIYGLLPSTTYTARAVVTNAMGTAYANNTIQFTTLPIGGGPVGGHVTTVTVLAKSATTKSIVVSGIAYGTATNARVWFEYGPTTALGQSTMQQYVMVNNMQVYSATISGLKPGTTYYYRAVVMDQNSVSRGDINYVRTLTGNGSTTVQTGTAVKSDKTILDKASDPLGFGNGQGAAALFGFGTGFFPTSLFGWLLLTFMLLLLIVLSRHYFAKKEVKK